MFLTGSILFWSAVTAAVFLFVSRLLKIKGLKLRACIREPATIVTGCAAALGVLQLLLYIRNTALRIVLIILWVIAFLFGIGTGYIVYAFHHCYEEKFEYKGIKYIDEKNETVSGCDHHYYEARGKFMRSINGTWTIPGSADIKSENDDPSGE